MAKPALPNGHHLTQPKACCFGVDTEMNYLTKTRLAIDNVDFGTIYKNDTQFKM